MSYDLHFFKQKPGQTFEEALEIFSSEQADSLPPIDPRTVADSLLGLHLGLVEFPKDFEEISLRLSIPLEKAKEQYSSIEINTKELERIPLQITLDRQMVSVTLPYWDFAPATVEGIRTYWDGILPALFVNGLVGHDPQLGAKIGDKSFDKMMSSIAGIAQKTPGISKAKKPWWKVW